MAKKSVLTFLKTLFLKENLPLTSWAKFHAVFQPKWCIEKNQIYHEVNNNVRPCILLAKLRSEKLWPIVIHPVDIRRKACLKTTLGKHYSLKVYNTP